MTINRIYNTNPGQFSIVDSQLAYTNIDLVSRNGVVYNVLQPGNEGTIGGLYVAYFPSLGRLNFDSTMPFEIGETINVIFEI